MLTSHLNQASRQNSSRFTKFHNFKISWSIKYSEYILYATQYSKSSLYFWKLLLLKSSRVSRVCIFWSALCILCVSVKQHLSVSEGCKRPVGSAQQGLPLDWLPMNLGDWVRLTSLSLRAIRRRECVNVWDQAPGSFTSSFFSMLYLARHKKGSKLFLRISRALLYF